MDWIKCPKYGKEEPAFDYMHICGPINDNPFVHAEMSQQILELAKRSSLTDSDGEISFWDVKELEQFARVVVAECITIVRKNHASTDGVQAIMKHFGIKE